MYVYRNVCEHARVSASDVLFASYIHTYIGIPTVFSLPILQKKPNVCRIISVATASEAYAPTTHAKTHLQNRHACA